jgi:hypothetical protein
MPPTHLGYSFSAKFWGRIGVDELSEIVFNDNAFDRLVLSDEYKDIIKAQVETFSRKGNELVSDLVENKGGGMIMVLHGKPGESVVNLPREYWLTGVRFLGTGKVDSLAFMEIYPVI